MSIKDVEKNVEELESFMTCDFNIKMTFGPIYTRLNKLMLANKIPMREIGKMTIQEVIEALKNES